MSTSAFSTPQSGAARSAYEARCRALLRAYPRSWRRHREDEILGLLLAMQDAENTRGSARQAPPWGVQADLVSAGVQTRWERLWSFLPASTRDRVAVRATVLGAAVCTVSIVFGGIACPWLYPRAGEAFVPPLVQIPTVVYGLWVLALVVTLAGRGVLARWLLAAATIAAALLSVSPAWMLTTVPLALAAALGTIGRLPTARTARGWMSAAYVLLTGVLMLTQRTSDYGAGVKWTPLQGFYLRGPGSAMQDLCVGIAAVALLAAVVATAFRRQWVPAIAVAVVPYLYLGFFARYGGTHHGPAVEMLPVLLSVVVLLAVADAVRRKHATMTTSTTAASTSAGSQGQGDEPS